MPPGGDGGISGETGFSAAAVIPRQKARDKTKKIHFIV
jgi:hypothetical protein